jgi:hypothetical protein
MGEVKNTQKMLVGEPEGKRKFGRPRRIWEDYIRMNLSVRGCGLDTSGSR